MTRQTGRIHWYDPLSREGLLKDEAGRLIYFYSENTTLRDGQTVTFRLVQDYNWMQATDVEGA